MSLAYLVESIPADIVDLRPPEGVRHSRHVFVELVDAAESTIDLTAMYWNLLSDVASEDEEGFTRERLEELGADHGMQLHGALTAAAERGVTIRIVQSPGFKGGPQESDKLAERYPAQIEVRTLHMSSWYGEGIMHQKMWIIDGRHIYIGSANADWKALTQVKELGIVVQDNEELAADAARLFEVWWKAAKIHADTREVFDPSAQVRRTVPSWSKLVPAATRSASPFVNATLSANYNEASPLVCSLNEQHGDVFVTCSPPEFCAPARSSDLDAILQAIHMAKESICISVMDFAPISLHRGQYDEESGERLINGRAAETVWWPSIIDALLHATLTRRVSVRLLVSHWAYTSPLMAQYLMALQETANVGKPDGTTKRGRLEIRRFLIPGWDDVSGSNRHYPGHSRVNHAKYIVTERQVNIGTSNMTWGYFANSAGTSFNSTHRHLVNKLQEVFDRDWASRYARQLQAD